MTLERLCTNFRDFRAKSVGVVFQNVFDKGRPGGGARGGPCEKSGLEVVIWHPRCVCVKFGVNRVNGRGDIAGRKVSKNVYDKGGAGGGAREAPWEKSQLEVVM